MSSLIIELVFYRSKLNLEVAKNLTMTEGKNKSKPEDSQQKMETHIEEDDEFEEFPQQDWQTKESAEDEEVRIVAYFGCVYLLSASC